MVIADMAAAHAVRASPAMDTAPTAPGGPQPGTGNGPVNVVMQEVPTPLASTTLAGAQGTGHASAGLTSVTGSPGVGASFGLPLLGRLLLGATFHRSAGSLPSFALRKPCSRI